MLVKLRVLELAWSSSPAVVVGCWACLLCWSWGQCETMLFWRLWVFIPLTRDHRIQNSTSDA